jgi:S1-C subfamily serine protease
VKLESAKGREKEFKTWGVSLRDVTRRYAADVQLDSDEGVVVTSLTPGGAAAKAELQAGDVILTINQSKVEDFDAFIKLYNASIGKKEDKALIEFQRGRARRSAVLKITYTNDASTQPVR